MSASLTSLSYWGYIVHSFFFLVRGCEGLLLNPLSMRVGSGFAGVCLTSCGTSHVFSSGFCVGMGGFLFVDVSHICDLGVVFNFVLTVDSFYSGVGWCSNEKWK